MERPVRAEWSQQPTVTSGGASGVGGWMTSRELQGWRPSRLKRCPYFFSYSFFFRVICSWIPSHTQDTILTAL
jgi:hypothetical protein